MRMFGAKACFEAVGRYGVTFLMACRPRSKSWRHGRKSIPPTSAGLHGIVTMGSPLERESCIRFQRLLTPRIFNGYGTTETFWNSFLRRTTCRRWRAAPDGPARTMRSASWPCTKAAMPARTRPSPTDGETPGEIILFAPYKSALCYTQNPELTAERYKNGWFYTHDVGTWDAGHYVTVRGRRDDMIVCMGENIYPLSSKRCSARTRRLPTAWSPACQTHRVANPSRPISFRRTTRLTAKELARWCAANDDLSDYKCPRYYRFVTGAALQRDRQEAARAAETAGCR